MAITPADIEQLTFSPSKHGYDTEEVDNFLEQLSTEVDSMLQKIADLKGRLNTSESQLQSSQAQVAVLQQQVAEAEAEAAEANSRAAAAASAAPAPAASTSTVDMAASEHQISQVLIVAQKSADKLVADAKDNAERIRNEADQKAREVIRQALAEKQNELDEIDRLKQSREDFRAEYKKLLQHFMDDADSVFPAAVEAAPAPAAPAQPAPAPAAAPEAPAATAQPAAPFATAPMASKPGEEFSDLD
jgi:cell division initiation protein